MWCSNSVKEFSKVFPEVVISQKWVSLGSAGTSGILGGDMVWHATVQKSRVWNTLWPIDYVKTWEIILRAMGSQWTLSSWHGPMCIQKHGNMRRYRVLGNCKHFFITGGLRWLSRWEIEANHGKHFKEG